MSHLYQCCLEKVEQDAYLIYTRSFKHLNVSAIRMLHKAKNNLTPGASLLSLFLSHKHKVKCFNSDK